MNSSVSAQRNNRRFFFLALSLAIGLVVASGFFVHGVLSGNSGGLDLSEKSCMTVMRTNGVVPLKKDNELSVVMATADSVESYVYRSGVIIASCPAYTVKDYCAGTGCHKPGVAFTLKHKDS